MNVGGAKSVVLKFQDIKLMEYFYAIKKNVKFLLSFTIFFNSLKTS